MSIKKSRGIVLVILVLFVFSGFFVSAFSFHDFFGKITGHVVAANVPNYTQTVTFALGKWASGEYIFTLPVPMSANNLSLFLGSVNKQKCNVSIQYLDSQGSVHPFISGGNYALIDTLSERVFFSFPPHNVYGVVISPAFINGCDIYSLLNPFNVSVSGQYLDLPDVSKSYIPGLAPNSQINFSLDPELEIYNVTFKYITSSSISCVITVSVLSGNVLKQIDSFNLRDVGQNRDLSRSIFIPSPMKNSKVIISSAGSKSKCYEGLINFTNVTIVGKTTYVCTSSFIEGPWSNCIDGHKNRTITDSNGCVNSRLEVVACSQSDCFDRCAINATNSISVPYISSLSSGAAFNGQANFIVGGGSTGSDYDLIWQYNYADGSIKQICACNGTENIGDVPTRVSSGNPSSTITIRDDNTKIISNISLFVFASKDHNRSRGYASGNIYEIDYGCESACNVLGKKHEVIDNNPSNYQVCEKVAGTSCFNLSSVRECPESAKLFNETSGGCVYGGVIYNCLSSSFCNFSTRSLTNSFITPYTCGVAGFGCYKCDDGFKYDSESGYCVLTSCFNQPRGIKATNCSLAGGVCNNSNSYVTDSHVNISLDCCNGDFRCFQCDSGYHLFNNTCVSDNCSGGVYPTGFNFSLGATSTRNPSVNMSWKYVLGIAGACEWNCSTGYELNLSTNNSCQPLVIVDCVQNLSGLCSSSTSVANAVFSLKGNCSGTQRCFICNSGYTPNGSSCAINCSSVGKVFNGIGCLAPLPSCSEGCPYDKDGGSICLPNKVRVNAPGNKQYYCNGTSHIFRPTLAEGASCSWDAQCADNFCFVNETGQTSVCQTLNSLSGIRSIIVDFVCWFKHMGDSAARQQCRDAEAASYLSSN